MAPPIPSGSPAPPRPRHGWWDELGLADLLEDKLHLTPERIEATVETSRDLGKSLAMSWHKLNDVVAKVLAHAPLGHKLSEMPVAESVKVMAGGLGYGLAGVEALAGTARLIRGFRQGDKTEKLEGFLDLTAGAAIASTIVGAGSVPLILGPIAAGLGVARGAVRTIKAYQAADPAKEVQGFLDTTRSATVMCALLSYNFAAAATVGAVIGPIAVGIQACRGYVSLRDGLAQSDKSAQIQGLADIGTAAGLTMSFTGLAVPGIALMVASQGAKLLYKVLPSVERVVDRALDKARLPLKVATGVIEHTIDPLFQKVRHWIDTHSPWQHGEDAKPPDKPPS